MTIKKTDESKGFKQFMDEVERQKLELIHNAEMRGFKRGYKLCEKQKNKEFQKKIDDIVDNKRKELRDKMKKMKRFIKENPDFEQLLLGEMDGLEYVKRTIRKNTQK